MEVKNVAPITVYYQSVVTNMKEIVDVSNRELPLFYEEAKKRGLDVSKPLQFLYFGCEGNMESDFTLEFALPVDAPQKSNERYKFKEVEGFKCVTTLHKGSLKDLGKTYEVFISEIYKNGLKPTSHGREVYHKYVDHDSSENLTEIQIGIN